MGDKTQIQWTDATWNPVTGCTKVSAGCKNCYAERVFPRAYGGATITEWSGDDNPVSRPRKFTDVLTHAERLEQPLHWKKPRRVFVNSMSDLFHEAVPFEFIRRVWHTMALANRHTFQILTKRPERLLEFHRWLAGADDISVTHWPRNCWLGVSVEDQKTADARIPLLLQTPAAVRFVSYEPALEAVDFEKVPLPDAYFRHVGVVGCLQPLSEKETEPDDYRYFRRKELKLDWIIVGGESGTKARPFNVQWARDVIAQCKVAGVACFVKQIGAFPGCETPIDVEWLSGVKDSAGGNPLEWPEDLRVREFPV